MSLALIVRALGGDLYAGGRRASVPAPGHSRVDRSVSLLLDGDRVIVHAFGEGVDWRAILAHLQDLGLVDDGGRLSGRTSAPSVWPSPSRPERVAMAAGLWELARPLEGTLAERHLRLRAIEGPLPSGLRFHPAVPLGVYRRQGRTLPALVAAVRDTEGRLTAVEITYLAGDGRRADLKLPRKAVGCLPAGSAVRLGQTAETLVVAEGVFSALSAHDRLGAPAWALLSAGNLAQWSPPAGVRHVLVAADRGAAGEGACARLLRRMTDLGVAAEARWPPGGFEDWNAAAAPDAAWRAGKDHRP